MTDEGGSAGSPASHGEPALARAWRPSVRPDGPLRGGSGPGGSGAVSVPPQRNALLPRRPGHRRRPAGHAADQPRVGGPRPAVPGPALRGTEGDRDEVAKGLAAQGVSAVEITMRSDGTWRPTGSARGARITGTTPVAFRGPVTARHPALGAGDAPVGTLTNSGHGATPWGSYPACEKNANSWFGTDDPAWRPTATQRRYGIGAPPHGPRWHEADTRFDLARTPNEPNRYGWVVEGRRRRTCRGSRRPGRRRCTRRRARPGSRRPRPTRG